MKGKFYWSNLEKKKSLSLSPQEITVVNPQLNINMVIDKDNNKLSNIMQKYFSDKVLYHDYTLTYENIFKDIRHNSLNILEIGIGSLTSTFSSMKNWNNDVNNKYTPGNSLRAWRDYFYNSNIYGCDIDKEILFEEPRIKTFYMDQTNITDTTFINLPEFDIIIDDGLHRDDVNMYTFRELITRLKSGGIYIIEDLHEISIFQKFQPSIPGKTVFLNNNSIGTPPDNFLWIFYKH